MIALISGSIVYIYTDIILFFCLVFNEKRYVTEASWRVTKANISFNITSFSLLNKINLKTNPPA